MTDTRTKEPMHVCFGCEGTDVTEQEETETFPYGVPESVEIQVTQIVIRCKACGEAWTDWRGEEAREAAVEKYRRVFCAPLEKRLRGYEAWERSVNEALNSGDGSYRP